MAKRRAANLKGEVAQGVAALIVMERRRLNRRLWLVWLGIAAAAFLGVLF